MTLEEDTVVVQVGTEAMEVVVMTLVRAMGASAAMVAADLAALAATLEGQAASEDTGPTISAEDTEAATLVDTEAAVLVDMTAERQATAALPQATTPSVTADRTLAPQAPAAMTVDTAAEDTAVLGMT